VARALGERHGRAGRRLLELGIGTGRLAIPLAADGWEVTGIDASATMLDRLRAKPAARGIDVVLGDLGDPATWPGQRYDVVLAAFNLLFNLTTAERQQAVLGLAAGHLAEDGAVVIEADAIDPGAGDERSVSPSVLVDGVTIETRSDHRRQLISGVHRGAGRDRPWQLRYVSPDQLDTMAAAAGLDLVERRAGWDGSAAGTRHVSWYRLSRPRPG